MRIGYGRVSTRDQNPDGQQDALVAAGCEQVFIDAASGKLASRPRLDEALRIARDGDQLVITKLDRLGRSLEHLIALPGSCRHAALTSSSLTKGSTRRRRSAGCSFRSSARSPSSSTP
jgi:DNA invertase Pin-like site-specific DNA recombinase